MTSLFQKEISKLYTKIVQENGRRTENQFSQFNKLKNSRKIWFFLMLIKSKKVNIQKINFEYIYRVRILSNILFSL